MKINRKEEFYILLLNRTSFKMEGTSNIKGFLKYYRTVLLAVIPAILFLPLPLVVDGKVCESTLTIYNKRNALRITRV